MWLWTVCVDGYAMATFEMFEDAYRYASTCSGRVEIRRGEIVIAILSTDVIGGIK